MPIRLRLTAAFTIVAALLFAVGAWLFLVGLAPEAEGNTLSQVQRELAVAGVVFVVVTGIGAYGLASAVLSPVERLRRQAASISAADTGASLEVPATRDELATLATTMNDLLARLQAALAKQRSFVSDASHELRTPLSVLRGELELAGRPGRDQADLVAAVKAAEAEAARLTRITDSLLLLARSDEDSMVLRRQRTSIAALLSECADAAQSRLTQTGTRIELDVPDGLCADIDPDRLRAAVGNLVDNALRFAPPASVIMLAARVEDAVLLIEVSDDGPGFPPGFLPHAFERFRRPDSGRSRDDGGSGLGLAIVRAIAVAHGGTATAENKRGGGARVRLLLPAPKM